ncbi:MAG: rRNA pseudouridine synthase [Vicinamibacteria bacterium]|nr:rRNA pseudouridine synthase [Vicinamibacteria bacterium]
MRQAAIVVDDQRLREPAQRVVIALHKPAGYITSRSDPRGRPTVYDLIADVGVWLFPVGRLDGDSEGLLILTNDHQLGERLTDPKHHVLKLYHVQVAGSPAPAALAALRQGATLPDGLATRPARVRLLGTGRGDQAWIEIGLREGKNRQVRRMCAAIGHAVLRLVRVGIGGLALGTLASGSWRRLSPDEVRRFFT